MQHDCLILEDCASNTLDKMLKDDTEANLLTWRVRVRIAIDIATALFMHRGGGGFGDARCLHGDLSLFNISLEGYTHKAKLLGCGLAMLFSNDDDDDEEGYFKEQANYFKERTNLKRKSISLKGWAVSPTEVKTNMYNLSSEVYAFGIFILELLYGISKEVAFEKERNLKEDMEKQVEKLKNFEID